MDIDAQIEELSKKITPGRFEKMRLVASRRTRYLTLVLEDIFQPHNAAAALRNCDAFGLQEVHFIENKFKLRISANVDMGVSKWQDVIRHTCSRARIHRNFMPKDHNVYPEEIANTKKALSGLKERGFFLAASVPGAQKKMQDIPVDKPVAILVGTERTGLSEAARECADMEFSIDMFGFAQSFNLSVFSALCLSELSARMRALPHWRLSAGEQKELLLRWLSL